MNALNFTIPSEMMRELIDASAYDKLYPYTFFEPLMQGRITPDRKLGDKPAHYYKGYLLK
jgi:hypothetical protein